MITDDPRAAATAAEIAVQMTLNLLAELSAMGVISADQAARIVSEARERAALKTL